MKTNLIDHHMMVFDSRLWEANGGDSKTDSFMRRACILKVYLKQDYSKKTWFADVRFEHDGRLSKGHFVNMMDQI